MFKRIRIILEMIKFSHSVFALPFAIIGALLAGRGLPSGWPRPGQILLVIVCMVAARSAAMTFNRIVDAEIDARNPRTANRALPRGLISRAWAWAFLLGMAGLFLVACAGFWVLYGNRWPMVLAVPALGAICAYSYMKRFTSLSHFGLGAAIGLSPAAAWIAVHPATLGLPAVLLSGAVMLWIAGFDIIYALQDVQVDRREGLFSLPARWGAAKALWISRLCHAGTVALLVWVGLSSGMGLLWYGGVTVVAVLLAVEQSMVSPTDFSKVNVAFFTVNGVVGVLLAVAAIADIAAGGWCRIGS